MKAHLSDNISFAWKSIMKAKGDQYMNRIPTRTINV